MTKRIVFEVSDEVAKRMCRQSVYLDVFGWVRWDLDGSAVDGAPRWVAL